MKRDIICFINNQGLSTFSTKVSLTKAVSNKVLNAKCANDISQALVDSEIGYSKSIYDPDTLINISVYFIMSTMYKSMHERNIYIVNCSDKSAKCIFSDKYIIDSNDGFIMDYDDNEKNDNLNLYCRAGDAKQYSLGVRFIPNKGSRLEYKLAI